MRVNESPIYERPCTQCGTRYKTTLPPAYYDAHPDRRLCTPCMQDREARRARSRHG